MADAVAKPLEAVPPELQPKLTEPVRTRGRTNDQPGTLHPDRQWLEVTCQRCGTRVFLEQPPDELNVVAQETTEVVTLSDGQETSVTAVMARPASTVTFECPGCEAAEAEAQAAQVQAVIAEEETRGVRAMDENGALVGRAAEVADSFTTRPVTREAELPAPPGPALAPSPPPAAQPAGGSPPGQGGQP